MEARSCGGVIIQAVCRSHYVLRRLKRWDVADSVIDAVYQVSSADSALLSTGRGNLVLRWGDYSSCVSIP